MVLFYRLPKRLKYAAILIFISLILFTAMRVAFWLTFRETADSISPGILLKLFFIGFKFDVRLSFLLVLPLLVLSWIPGINPIRSSRGIHFWAGHFSFLISITIFVYFCDFAHYAYLDERVDVSALRFLQNPVISLRMIWETYPIFRGGLVWLLFGVFLYFLFRFLLMKSMTVKSSSLKKWKQMVVISLGIIIYLFGIYGKFSYYPLRWSDAFFTTDRFGSNLALNPLLFFFDTLWTSEQNKYDEEKVREYYDKVASYLKVTQPNREQLVFSRKINPTPYAAGRPNVVIIFLESFSAHKTGILGNTLNPSPYFDAIAKDSLLFTRLYTPRRGTARGVFATLTGIPDIITYRTASRNPAIVRQYTILNAFEGYEKFYFLGGSANWANIRGLFSHNVKGLRIYEEGDFSSKRVDVWGISDLHLFEEANRILRRLNNKPFFAFIHTSGNHRPYNIPEDNRNFRMTPAEEIGKNRLNKNGFHSLAAFNAFRFLDHSIGFFIRIASSEQYFKNTVFVFVGDEGLLGNSPHLPRAEKDLNLGSHHVPLAIYAPAFIPKGKVFDIVASQMDVLPTIAGITGSSFLNTTIGRNLLDTRFDSQRYAFIQSRRGKSLQIGLLSDEFYLVMNTAGTDIRLHSYYSEIPTQDVGKHFPERVQEMSSLCLGLYHTSKYLLYHNSPSLYLER